VADAGGDGVGELVGLTTHGGVFVCVGGDVGVAAGVDVSVGSGVSVGRGVSVGVGDGVDVGVSGAITVGAGMLAVSLTSHPIAGSPITSLPNAAAQ